MDMHSLIGPPWFCLRMLGKNYTSLKLLNSGLGEFVLPVAQSFWNLPSHSQVRSINECCLRRGSLFPTPRLSCFEQQTALVWTTGLHGPVTARILVMA